MGFRKSIGIIAFCTQAVVVVDYNMQSHKAGLGPGELSMKAYGALVQARYDRPQVAENAAQQDGRKGWDRLAQFGTQIGTAFAGHKTVSEAQAQSGAAPVPPAPVCIRRGMALNCE